MKQVKTGVDVQALIKEYEAKETSPAKKRELRWSILAYLASPFMDFCHKHGVKGGQNIHVNGAGTLTWTPEPKRRNRQGASRSATA